MESNRDTVEQKIRELLTTIGEGTLGLGVNLIVLIMVERVWGEAGLGVFSYLLSLYYASGFLSEFGLPNYLEREAALNKGNSETGSETVARTRQATLLLSLLVAGLLLLAAAYDTALTPLGERIAAYLIIGMTLPVRNYNELILALLQAEGDHDRVATLKGMKRILFLGAILIFLMFHVPPSYLVLAFFLSELLLLVSMAVNKTAGVAASPRGWQGWNNLHQTMGQGSRFLFTDKALDMVFYMDFLILGLFVSSSLLGVYAEASVIARFFLIVPMSIKPIYRARYCEMTVGKKTEEMGISVLRSSRVLFFLHSLLALYVMLYFPFILNAIFHVTGQASGPFQVFSVLIPGLLYFSAVTSQDPVYEAEKRAGILQRHVLTVTLINLGLNCYLVPFAGLMGAAFATMLSMMAYFLIFGRGTSLRHLLDKPVFLLAGAAVYLTYVIVRALDAGLMITVWLVPALLFIFLFVMDFFNFDKKPPME